MSLHYKTIAQCAASLANKEVSSVELTNAFLERIEQHNPHLNCFISICDEPARAAAKAADACRAKGEAKPLTGIPFAHKDVLCTQGVKTTCASKMLDNFIPPYNATVVKNLADAGVVMLGKTNMDEFAMGSSNENSYYGAVLNPWHADVVPGGSSGGSAAAVAARIIPATTGTDTGGSIRQPAALCGITGIKPTYGRVSRYGLIAFASSLDQAGPMAQTAEDCALLLNAMAGFDEKDSTSLAREVPDYCAELNKDIKGLTIGLPKQYFTNKLDSEIADCISAAIKIYESMGAIIKEIELPNTDLAVPVYYVVAPAEASSNLSRFDGIRFGYTCDEPKDLMDMYKRTRSEGFGKEVQRRIMIGTYALSAGYYDAYYVKAQKIRRLISNDFTAAFKDVDVILGPTTPTTAFKIGDKTQDPVQLYLSDIYTISVNLAGLPGMSIPAGFVNGLPVGMQLIGNYFAEARLLNVAHQYQQATDWHKQIPEGF